MTASETMLKAAHLAFPGKPWQDFGGWIACEGTFDAHPEFNPHDPTKGDLAALNEALERAGWEFWFAEILVDETPRYEGRFFARFGDELSEYAAPTPAERAILCVEAMP